MADRKRESKGRKQTGEPSAGEGAEPLEGFGPVTSLEPDGVTPLRPGTRERVTLSMTWESVTESTAPTEPRPENAGAQEPPKADWSRVLAAQEEDEGDAGLLDDGFLKRTFKEVRFPASKELCLRYVDQEQDFAYGKDRTVNLHNLIIHLEEEEFATRRDLLKAIRERLAHHHEAHHPG